MSHRRIHVLLVDDDPATHKILKPEPKDNYELDSVENAEDAWELIFSFGKPFDLIIIDILLPKTDGIELLRKIREINSYIPVLIITAHSNHERAKLACNLRVSGYIEKPFDEEEIKKKIMEIAGYTKNDYMKLASPLSLIDKKMSSLHPTTIKCLQKIHHGFHSTINMNGLAYVCGVSKYHLCKIFRKDCGMTIRTYLNKIRMETAKQLLRDSTYKISEIQEFLGYKSRTHFFNTFKKVSGHSPLRFRKMNKTW